METFRSDLSRPILPSKLSSCLATISSVPPTLNPLASPRPDEIAFSITNVQALMPGTECTRPRDPQETMTPAKTSFPKPSGTIVVDKLLFTSANEQADPPTVTSSSST
ncbi:hypothetical protein OPT61_g2782 [Boeremia exigua]|uniref:Uncharacterized protein n=1 Tax=Boeremia exigua TaxID=749465 RepID=A0ACC2IKA3_9PLEO|nr:hypothetical protein OPT61_g2782 [Boeremia exigua]